MLFKLAVRIARESSTHFLFAQLKNFYYLCSEFQKCNVILLAFFAVVLTIFCEIYVILLEVIENQRVINNM